MRRAAACGLDASWKMSLDKPADTAWHRGALAAALLAVDPRGLGGLTLRARASPVRDAFCKAFAHFPHPMNRLHPSASDETLFGAMDLSATLAAGEIVKTAGLLDRSQTLILTMAERTSPQLAARLALALDGPDAPCLIALDEGAEPDESLLDSLKDRLAFSIDLTDSSRSSIVACEWDIEGARARLESVDTPQTTPASIVEVCTTLGISGVRAPLFALRAARALAALEEHTSVLDSDVETACALTLAHRATRLPEPLSEDTAPPPEPSGSDNNETHAAGMDLPQELLLEAVRALIPDGLLDRIAAGKSRAARGSGTGARKRGSLRGRPLPSRPGKPGGNARVDIVATLRTAAPWQTIRAAARPDHHGLHLRPDDIRIKHYEDRADRLLIFAVDASGSSALARLAEAKGAVELMLAQAYARRDHVALIAFRGTTAEILLPPTRSLVQTKRRLSALPGGGGTPLAAGLKATLSLADQALRKGMTPTLALLTDGRANIALDGTANRGEAAADALQMAAALGGAGLDSIVIDTGRRPERSLELLAGALGGAYVPMPRADAARMADAVTARLET